jgi:putative redox protein
MSNELKVTLNLVNDKLHFTGRADSKEIINIDYTPPFGDNLGHTSLELFLLSLSSCVGSSILLLLRKMKKTIIKFEVNAKGIRREHHPTCFEKINLEYLITSDDVKNEDVDKVIKLSEETYCPVWAMIKNNVEVNIEYKIILNEIR